MPHRDPVSDQSNALEIVYCVVCQTVHTTPVAVSINDRCPMHGHTLRCVDNSFLFHAATGDDADCICSAARDERRECPVHGDAHGLSWCDIDGCGRKTVAFPKKGREVNEAGRP